MSQHSSFLAPAPYQPSDGVVRRRSQLPSALGETPGDKVITTHPIIQQTRNTSPQHGVDYGQLDHNENTQNHSISQGPVSKFLGSCVECGLRINSIAEACHAMGYLYHNTCFLCCYCQRTLRGKVFYKDQDKIFCEEDYHYCGFQKTFESCKSCGHLIADTILLALGNTYHPACFKCCICSKCLDGVPFTVGAGDQIYCLNDYHLVHAPRCGACGFVIMPTESSDEIIRVMALDREFHLECYHCCDCKRNLGNETDSRCYPMTLSDPNSNTDQQVLLCLNCHLRRIDAVPATTASSVSPTGRAQPRPSSPLVRYHPVSASSKSPLTLTK